MIENLKCLFKNFPIDIFIMLFIPLILLWWYFNSLLKKSNGTVKGLEERIDFLEKELEACRKIKIIVPDSSPISNISTGEVFVKKDDLKIVEGIGPKIEELFYKAGVFSFEELAKMPASKMQEILFKAGSRFQIHDPTTWADQAALARDGKWDELKKWQAELNKGRITH